MVEDFWEELFGTGAVLEEIQQQGEVSLAILLGPFDENPVEIWQK